eukprot:3379427-Alexandrium_andersonii.AAC.1
MHAACMSSFTCPHALAHRRDSGVPALTHATWLHAHAHAAMCPRAHAHTACGLHQGSVPVLRQ